MSVKSNLKQIQEEFKNDEKMLENAFKLERFYRKYKYYIFIAIAFLVLWFGYSQFASYQDEKQAQKTTIIYDKLLKDPQNQALLDSLKKNSSDLFDIYEYAQALKEGNKENLERLKSSQNSMIKILADYQFASFSQNLEDLEKNHTTPMRDLAILQEAYLLQKKGKVLESRALLDQIQINSSVYLMANLLKHYGILMQPNSQSQSKIKQDTINQEKDKNTAKINNTGNEK